MCVYLRKEGGVGGGGLGNTPTAIFKSHFTPLRVKRPDTALGRRQERRREGEGQGTEGGTRETGRK